MVSSPERPQVSARQSGVHLSLKDRFSVYDLIFSDRILACGFLVLFSSHHIKGLEFSNMNCTFTMVS
jgi:hypothetical protein